MKFIIARLTFGIFLLLICFGQITYGCSCFPVSSGAEYQVAKGVFKGKLVNMERSRETRHLLHYYFEIYHTYKGTEKRTLKLTYPDTECREPFEVGGDYLIYENNGDVQRYCNLTGLTSDSKQAIEFLDRFETNNPLLKIEGFISKFSDDPTAKALVSVRSADGTEAVSVDADGFFSAIMKRKQSYTVIVTFPDRRLVEVTDGGIDFTEIVRVRSESNKTVLEYDVDFTKTFLDRKRIEFAMPTQKHVPDFSYTSKVLQFSG